MKQLKKWIFISIFVTIILVGIATVVYINSREPLNSMYEQALERLQTETELTNIEEFSRYNGEKSYLVFKGANKKSEKVIAWVPSNHQEDIILEKWANGITKEDALNTLKNEVNPKEILSVHLGIERVGPVWEITYLDEQDALNYYYLLFRTGEWWRNIENL